MAAQTREYKSIQSGTATVDIAINPLVAQGFKPILMTSSPDSKGTIIVVVLLEKITPIAA